MLGYEIGHPGCGAVVDNDMVAVAFQIEHQILTHDGQAGNGNIPARCCGITH